MIKKETDARMIGYGAMLIEGLVGVVAMIAAATLPVNDYYAMNTELAAMPQISRQDSRRRRAAWDRRHRHVRRPTRGIASRPHRRGGDARRRHGAHLRFRRQKFTGGTRTSLKALWKYWYHFAIMFEALFILTTIDAGTRIGRFLLQEVAGKIHPSLGISGGWPSAFICTALIVLGWAWFMGSDSFMTIWAMFGVANQMLAVIALAIVSAYLANVGKAAISGSPCYRCFSS